MRRNPTSPRTRRPASRPTPKRARPAVEQLEDRVVPAITLLADVNTDTLGSGPKLFTEFNGALYFVANDGVNGQALWKTDGTEAGTVLAVDVRTSPDEPVESWPPGGPTRDVIFELVAVGDTLYFTADVGVAGIELFKTDGTPEGTSRMAEPFALRGVGNLAGFEGRLYFSAFSDEAGQELWVTDGTPEGTALFKDIRPGPAHSSPRSFHVAGDTMYFTAGGLLPTGGVNAEEVWKTDGTPEGTVLVKDIQPGPAGSQPGGYTTVGGVTYFFAREDPFYGLYRTDGSEDGTYRLDSDPRPASSIHAVGDLVFYSFRTQDLSFYTLEVTDGTPEGTRYLGDFGVVAPLGDLGGRLVFRASTPETGDQIWVSDGTPEGTHIMKEFGPGAVSSGTRLFRADEDVGYLSVLTPDQIYQMYRTDGTEEGTVYVSDLNVTGGYVFGGQTFLLVADARFGAELWTTDGTAGGTALFKDINTVSGGSNPYYLATVGDAVYFAASSPSEGLELWKTADTPSGAALVKEFVPGPGGGDPYGMTDFGGTVYFAAYTPELGVELWKSDGTADGTVLVKDIVPGAESSSPISLFVAGGLLYFNAYTPELGVELWKTDGTEEGTRPVKDLLPGNVGYGALAFVSLGDALCFLAYDGIGYRLYRTDGTDEGTVTLGPSTGYFPSVPARVGDRLYFWFSADFFPYRQELWTSDGTPEGTRQVTDLGTVEGFGYPQVVGELAGKVALSVYTAETGFELWVSDGTAEGTALVKDLVPGPVGTGPVAFVSLGDTAYFTAYDANFTLNLYRTDGTESGTYFVAPLNAFVGFAHDGQAYFTAYTAETGNEVWTTDGTAAGTRLVYDLNPGPASSVVYVFPPVVLNGKLVYPADDGRHGVELFTLSPPPRVESVAVNDGSAQRSMVTSLTVTFNGLVDVADGAFVITSSSGDVITPEVSLAVVGGKTVATLTFEGDAFVGGSLADGTYTLTVVADKVTKAGVSGDTLAADHVTEFYRLFGDSDGDGDVDSDDQTRFIDAVFAGSSDPLYSAFDYNGDGTLGTKQTFASGEDFRQFKLRKKGNH